MTFKLEVVIRYPIPSISNSDKSIQEWRVKISSRIFQTFEFLSLIRKPEFQEPIKLS